MAISVDWATGVVSVPQADLTDLGGDKYELDLDWFRLQLKALEASEEGLPWPDIHRHSTEVVVSGITLSRVIEIINGYTVTFEDGQYAVNLVGANSNVADVTNVNQVSVRPFNSAGLVTVSAAESAADIANATWASLVEDTLTAQAAMRILLATMAGKGLVPSNGGDFHFRDQADTKNRVAGTVDSNGNRNITEIDGS